MRDPNTGNVFKYRQWSVIAPDIYEGTRTTSTRRSAGEKDADKILGILDKRSFDPHSLAYLMASEHIELQKPLFELAIAILNAMAGKAAAGTTRNDEEYNRCMASRFAIEQIIVMMGS
jgi:hypothetical protein